MTEFYDRFDNRIVPGDYVVYGRNLGRCATTAIGRVVEVKCKLGWNNEPLCDRDGAPTGEVKLVLDSVQSDQGYRGSDGMYVKRITIQESERVILYSPKLINAAVRLAFKKYDDERAVKATNA